MAGQEPQLQALRQAVTFAMTARDAMQGRLTEKQHILDEQASIIGNIEQRLERLLAMAKRLTPNPYTRTVEHEQLDMNPHSERGNEQTWCTLLVGLELQLNNVQQAIVTQESTSQELSRLEHELAQADAQLHATGLSRASAIQRMEALEMATIASQQSPSHGADATLRHLYAVGRLVQAAAAGRGADEWQSVHQLEQDAHTATNPDERAMLGVLHTVAMTIIDVFKTFETKAGQAAQQTQDRLSEALERVAECEAELEDAAFEHPDPELMSTITKREADRLEVKYSSLSKQHAQEVAGLKQLNTDLTARLDNITQEHAALKAKPPVGRFSASEWGDDSDQPDPSEELKARNKQVAKLTKKCEAAEAKLTELTDQLETERRAVGQEQQSIQSQSKAHKAELQANRDRAAQELKECRRHAENDLAQLQKELKTTQKEAAVNKDAATQLASKTKEWQELLLKLDETEQARSNAEKTAENRASKIQNLEAQQTELNNKIRGLEKRIVAAGEDSNSHDDLVEGLEWEISAQWEPNQAQVDALEPGEDEDKGFMVEVTVPYKDEHISLAEGDTAYVTNWTALEAPGLNRQRLWYAQVLSEGEFGDGFWFPVRNVRCEDVDAMQRTKTYVKKLELQGKS